MFIIPFGWTYINRITDNVKKSQRKFTIKSKKTWPESTENIKMVATMNRCQNVDQVYTIEKIDIECIILFVWGMVERRRRSLIQQRYFGEDGSAMARLKTPTRMDTGHDFGRLQVDANFADVSHRCNVGSKRHGREANASIKTDSRFIIQWYRVLFHSVCCQGPAPE